jgi:hypothetical protein
MDSGITTCITRRTSWHGAGRDINGIDSFLSYAKTRLARKRGMRLDKFFKHLKETELRWKHRRENLYFCL